MPEVHQAPPGGKGADTRPALDLTTPAALRAWLAAQRTQIADLYAAAEDATRPLARRALGRPTARAAIHQAHRALQQLLTAAEPDNTP